MTRIPEELDLKWQAFFGLLCELDPSGAARRVGELVFGGKPSCGPSKVEKPPKLRERSAEEIVRGMRRQTLVSAFSVARPNTPEAYIYRTARVDRRDWNRWRDGLLKDSSIMSERIERVIYSEVAKDSPHSPH